MRRTKVPTELVGARRLLCGAGALFATLLILAAVGLLATGAAGTALIALVVALLLAAAATWLLESVRAHERN